MRVRLPLRQSERWNQLLSSDRGWNDFSVDAYTSQGKSVGGFVDMSVRQASLLGFNSLLRYMVTHKSVKLIDEYGSNFLFVRFEPDILRLKVGQNEMYSPVISSHLLSLVE